ncbi:MAG: hypothetical protein ACK4RK_15520 [Gemmataceae bacterium]
MKLCIMDFPAEPSELAPWLERQLVGPRLAELVAELAAVHKVENGSHASLNELLAHYQTPILSQGLSVLPAPQLSRLLRQPRLLLELQALVLEQGGSYWDRLIDAAAPFPSEIRRGANRLRQFLNQEFITPAVVQIAWYRRPWFVSLATAAALVLTVSGGLYYFPPLRPMVFTSSPPALVHVTTPAWGWAKPAALPQDLPAPEYLDHLADAANDWFKQRPDTPAALSKRILEMRQGCSVLLLAEHAPLTEADRGWLRLRCRAWAAHLDELLHNVEMGHDVQQVRTEADQVVRQLVAALRTKAKERATQS